MSVCNLCAKTPTVANNVPKSVHKTKRAAKPNLQKISGILICTRCARTIKKYQS